MVDFIWFDIIFSVLKTFLHSVHRGYVLEHAWECGQYVQHIQLTIVNIGKM